MNPNISAIIDIPTNSNEIVQKNEEKEHIPFYKQFLKPKVYITGLLVYIVTIIYNTVYTLILNCFDNVTNSNNEGLNEIKKENPIFVTIYICTIGPIIEELLCRRLIFWFINKYNKIAAYLLSSFFFAFGHFSFNIYVLLTEFYYFPLYFIMGALFAYAYDRDGCILAAIIAHILHNSTVIFLQEDKL